MSVRELCDHGGPCGLDCRCAVSLRQVEPCDCGCGALTYYVAEPGYLKGKRYDLDGTLHTCPDRGAPASNGLRDWILESRRRLYAEREQVEGNDRHLLLAKIETLTAVLDRIDAERAA